MLDQVIQVWNIKGLHHPVAGDMKIWVCCKNSVPLCTNTGTGQYEGLQRDYLGDSTAPRDGLIKD